MRSKRYVAFAMTVALLAGCAAGGEKEMVASSISYEETTTAETFAETTEEAETTFTETATVEVTETETLPPETTTIVTTTMPPETTTTAPPPTETTTTAQTEPPVALSGTTSKGYSITVSGGVTYVDGVLIANKTYALPSTYNPGGLTSETYAAFKEMQSAASAAGHYIFMKSGFRSYADQRYIYNGYAAKDGQALADTYSARAGHSEHQSGMAIDVNSLYTSFANTPEGIWLRENCHLYGFIIRYPEDKTEITGYMYEPWHIRYVGRELSGKIKESGLCLEEYFGITSQYGY